MSSIAHPTLTHPRVGVTVSPVVAGTQLGTVFPVVERFTAFGTVFSLKSVNIIFIFQLYNQSTLIRPCIFTTSPYKFQLLYNQSTLIRPCIFTTSPYKF